MLTDACDICVLDSAESAAAPALSCPPVEDAASDPSDVVALMLNLDASLQVHARSHFLTWTQGLLRSLLRHEVLICMLPTGERSPFRIDSFSRFGADASVFSEPLATDTSLGPELIDIWRMHRHQPVLVDRLETSVIGRSALAGELKRLGATQVVMHGCHDGDGEVTGFFVFACWAGTLSPRQLYYVRLVVPFLHAAWMRAQLDARQRGDEPGQQGTSVVTAREQEVLRWIYLGKTNSEIGLILGISTETVKDHVQNLLRKLNVVNRAQAVGKALDARILRPVAVPGRGHEDSRRRRPPDHPPRAQADPRIGS
jgi:transcriptional regulator EpsA